MSTTDHAANAGLDYRIPPGSRWAGAWKIAAAISALGLGGAAYGFKVEPERFAFSYLFAFLVTLSLALGSLFFVMVQFVTKANWGVTVRRIAELFMRPMEVFALLVLPLVFVVPQLFPWAGDQHGAIEVHADTASQRMEREGNAESSPIEEARGDVNKEPLATKDLPVPSPKRLEKAEQLSEIKIVEHKRFYLNRQFFLARLGAYLIIWWLLSVRFFNWSSEQDKTKALENTVAAQRFAPAGLVLFGVTITFFAFDWLLSLDATWYSTIFGVYFFAGMCLFNMAILILTAQLFARSGLLGSAVNVEHFHDMGKLLFGWIAFWSYIAFAQFFLTWYSNIPDEIAFFHKRWHDNGGTWKEISLGLVAMHFFIPFWFLMSRNIKRRLPLLAIGAAVMALMHVMDIYWIVMPNLGPFDPNLLDLACLLGVFGAYLACVLYGMRRFSLVAVGDPRLARALHFENA